jgi:homeobox-leucine zipper protein
LGLQAIQERHENSLLKFELENLQKDNRAMREQTKRPLHCANCGAEPGSSDGFDAAVCNQEQQLQLENARLRAEVSASMPYVIGLDLLIAAIRKH